MDEARAAVKEWDASRKKKRSKTDSDDGSGSDDGEDTHRRKKKKSKVSKSAKPVENKQISYRDRAKERRKGASGIEDVSAYLQKNIVTQQPLPPTDSKSTAATTSGNKRENASNQNGSSSSSSSSGKSTGRRKKSKKSTTSLGDRVLRVLQQMTLGSASITIPPTRKWLEGNVVYHYDVHPNPVVYDVHETPTIVTSSNESMATTDNIAGLTDRQKHPSLSSHLLGVLDLAMGRSSRGLTDPHPASLKRREREQQARVEKKKQIERQLEIKKKEIAAMMASTGGDSTSSSNKTMLTMQDDEDDIFADAGDYVAILEEENEEEDDDLEILPPTTCTNVPVVVAVTAGGGSGTPPMSHNDSHNAVGTPVLLPQPAPLHVSSTIGFQNIKAGDIAYYTKQNKGTDTLTVLHVHPESESLTVLVACSYDPNRIGRELNVMPSSERFHILPSSNDDVLLSIPEDFRKRVSDMLPKNNEDEQKREMLLLERDMVDYVLNSK
jgi:hypothetical protein